MTARASHIYCARAYIAESRRRGRTPFAFTLLQWAANCRRRAAASDIPVQRDLFQGSA